MNKPAPKEPSMDEILSSIRQIIADDDAAVAPRKAVAAASVPAAPITPAPAAPVPAAVRPAFVPPPPARPREVEASDAPLALTAEQMVRAEPLAPPPRQAAPLSFDEMLSASRANDEIEMPSGEPELVDPEDIAFETDELVPDPQPEPVPVPVYVPPPAVRAAPPPVTAPAPRPDPRPAPGVAGAAPMPDPTLSRDMAEQLLAPATDAVVKGALNKLNGLSMIGGGVTLDALMREMLRPMLKEWLDENLPSVVERMVEKEIARISRGGD